MKKELIVKDNALINASYSLELTEQRIILLAILKARENKTPHNQELIVTAQSYITAFNVHRNTAYKTLKTACDNLLLNISICLSVIFSILNKSRLFSSLCAW